MTDQGNSVTRRFLVLRATRWLPTGLLIPVLILLLVDREFSLAQIGLAAAAQGLMVFLLELPTGGLADALGRKPVLVVASVVDVGSLMVLLFADQLPVLVLAFVLQGMYRALESGPLDAWFVDELGADGDVETGLARGGLVLGVAVAAGALLSAVIVAVDPIAKTSALAVALVVAIALRVFDVFAIVMLMHEDADRRPGSLSAQLREVPAVVAVTVRTVRASKVLAGLIAVEFVWGFGMTSFETLTPVKLAEVVDGTDAAARLFGPAVAAAWVVSAAGAALVPALSRRIGTAGAAMALHVAQGVVVASMALSTGRVGVLVFYLVTMGVHGAANPAYQTLLHRQAGAAHRTTLLSAASMAGHPGSALGGITLGAIAGATSVSTAMIIGAVALASAAVFYRPARRQTESHSLHSARSIP